MRNLLRFTLANTVLLMCPLAHGQSADAPLIPTSVWSRTPVNPAGQDMDKASDAMSARRSTHFNDSTATSVRLDSESSLSGLSGVGHSVYRVKLEPIPVKQSTTIVVGAISGYHSYFSQDRTSIFTEISFSSQQVLKDTTRSVIPNKPALIVERGGAIRLADGRVSKDPVPSGEVDLQINGRYILFLRYNDDLNAFEVVKAWEDTKSSVTPLAPSDIQAARLGKSPYASMSHADFVAAVMKEVHDNDN